MTGIDGFVVYTIPNCQWCDKAKRLLADSGHSYVEVDASGKEDRRRLRERLPFPVEKLTVPQIWHGDKYIGGFTALEAYLKKMGVPT